ncbi:GMC oxidoreductase-domain-containing protein [Umbelopsis sp. PMI_123]|nr:GMC oxidoreductase-domain-containing protein [Umbelopsis sp. PMI_123]
MMDAAEEVGWKKNLDLNSGNPIGVGMAASTLQGGMRATGASAHIQPDTPNLTIMVLSTGTKVIGVQVNGNKSVYAFKEVILRAGTVDTPKLLLLLSGIGPAKELESLHIDVIKDIPGIGKNMQDHCGSFVSDVVDAAMSPRAPFIHTNEQLEEARIQWVKDRTGPLSVHYTCVVAASLKQEHLYDTPEFQSLSERTKSVLQRPTIPAFEICFNTPAFPPDHVYEKGTTSFTTTVILQRAESRGSVTLMSPNPSDPPLVDPNYLNHPYDQLTLIEGVRESRKLKKNSSLRKYHIKPLSAPADDSDEAIWDYIKSHITPIWHACGTVVMGKADDPMACVDSDMKLPGLQNLRVADMSVAPVLISGHTQSVAYLIGQTAAEKIIREYDLDA